MANVAHRKKAAEKLLLPQQDKQSNQKEEQEQTNPQVQQANQMHLEQEDKMKDMEKAREAEFEAQEKANHKELETARLRALQESAQDLQPEKRIIPFWEKLSITLKRDASEACMHKLGARGLVDEEPEQSPVPETPQASRTATSTLWFLDHQKQLLMLNVSAIMKPVKEQLKTIFFSYRQKRPKTHLNPLTK
ncbi:hypothetical protein Y1Q_0004437 [Alligator mississippiensis]|uniref:Uncharacterized protein n=1 Tax=Alligator mississippiensis TaxID=8496 RepID=A0A151NT05_ALLMI|nr:hypothetical protein Y1Q_0004437 [Alligator mississippiensis]